MRLSSTDLVSWIFWGRMKQKSELPEKTCPVCQRPFKWRKKWRMNWDRVIYCSERCRRSSKSSKKPESDY
ncbi:MAG: DUF2256 domain-containing protein [SAR324 cluster bacterium]|nr:DUF2256 domain-containing protein [SAR324 cluster bacterium]